MKNNIEMSLYRMQRVTENGETFDLNIGSTSPLHAREHQKLIAANKNSRKVIYTPPTGEPFSLLVSNRQFNLLAAILDGKWYSIESLKTTKAETRKPISELRQLGLIIGTKRKPGEYRLFGTVELYPLGLNLGVQSVGDILPSISECKLIEDAKAVAGIAKRRARISKTVEFLEGGENGKG